MSRIRRPGPAASLGLTLALLAATIVMAHVAIPLFVAFGIAFLVAVGLAAERWPLATLAAGALATLADPVLVPRLMPAGLGTGPIGLSEPVLAVAGGVIALDAIRTGRWRRAVRDPVVALMGLFIGLAVVSAAVNATPSLVAALGILMTVDAIAMYVAVRAVRVGERGAALVIGAVVGAAVVVALFGIGQVVIHPRFLGFAAFEGYFGEGGRITAFLGNPNPVAMILALGIPFALFGSLSLMARRDRWIARAVLVLLSLALVLTFSRSAWLAVALGVVIGALIVDWRAIPVLVLALAVAWAAFTVMPRGLAVAQPEPAPGTSGGGGPSPSAPDLVDTTADRIGNLAEEGDTRGKFTREGIPIILDHPWLGVGPGRYGGAAATLIPSPIYAEYHTSLYGYRTIHNFWQHLLGESGALGTAVFLTVLAGLLIRFARAARAALGRRRVILAGATTVVAVGGFHGLSEMIWEGNLPALLIWLILGIASVLAPVRPLVEPTQAADLHASPPAA
jgi:putative inorganic carbon (hco3(-)) transporter